MNWLSAQAMSGLLTAPYQRGAETMEVPLGPDGDSISGRFTSVTDYNFREYKARYGSDPPPPKYVVFPKTNTGNDEMQLEFQFSFGAITAGKAVVTIPPRTLAGVSFVIPLPENANASLRLMLLRQLPQPLSGAGAANWGVVTLLGNISKLAWVLGREKDEIRGQLLDVQQQRRRAFAHGYSLDQLGADLRVPRFPPREHSFDPDTTLALYHLNEVAPAVPAADEAARFNLPAHPGIIIGAQGGAIGKFGTAFSFPNESTFATIVVENHADFNIPADRSFTVEAFVKAESLAGAGPRIVIMKRAAESAAPLLLPGWSITLGTFRGITNNVMWAISDSVREVKIFADINIADGKFHHLAAAVDRQAKRTRLFVDGEEVASAGIDRLGAIDNPEFMRIGRSVGGDQFVGVIDEVRLSKIARTDFHPVLGESDEAYRLRLGIFERWLLPTPANLLKAINDAVRIKGDPESFVLIEKDRASTVATKLVRIIPRQLAVGQSIDRDGGALSNESEISGTAADDQSFNEIYLLRHERPEVNYLGIENNRRMQAPVKNVLDTLVGLLAQAAVSGKLIIRKSFDPADNGLHSVGRALRLTHENLALSPLGAMAHKAGFDFVRNEGSEIYASMAAGEKLEIGVGRPQADPPPPPGIDVFSSKTIHLQVVPDTLPINGEFDWTLITCDAGRAHFEAHPEDAGLRTAVTSRRRLQLVADAPGEVTLRVEYMLARRTVSATRTIRISIENLPNNRTIAGDGDMQIVEAAAVGTPETAFNPIYLITSNAPVAFGPPDSRRMQIVLERPFLRLVKLIQDAGAATNQLRVLQTFDPASPGLHRVGRAMRLRHNVLDAGLLGALAHRAGFGFVKRTGADIFVSVAEGEKIEIVRADNQTPLSDEVVSGLPIELQARFQTLPADGEFNWSTRKVGNGDGSMDVVLQAKTKFTPGSPGLLALSVTYLEADPQSTNPYTFEIRLKSALDVPGTNIPKHQYDLLMNVLNYFHPIGVEVVTRNIREHVVEVQGSLLNAFPGYTYPDFRA